jgi:hypothetical protein
MASAPFGYGHDGASQARPARLERRHPSASPSSPPIEGESEEVEGRRTLAARLPRWRARKRQEPGLIRMKAEPKALEATSNDVHHPLRVVLSLETDDEIVTGAARRGAVAPGRRGQAGLRGTCQPSRTPVSASADRAHVGCSERARLAGRPIRGFPTIPVRPGKIKIVRDLERLFPERHQRVTHHMAPAPLSLAPQIMIPIDHL